MAVAEVATNGHDTAGADLDRLAGDIDRFLATAIVVPAVAAARAACNEAGVHRYQAELLDAEDLIRRGLEQKRRAEVELDQARSDHAAALAEAEWMLGDRFVVESNKTYLVDPANAEAKRQMTADEKRAWLAREAAKQPAVADTAKRLQQVDLALAEARDAIDLARLAFTARKHCLDAAVVELQTLATSLTTPRKASAS